MNEKQKSFIVVGLVVLAGAIYYYADAMGYENVKFWLMLIILLIIGTIYGIWENVSKELRKRR